MKTAFVDAITIPHRSRADIRSVNLSMTKCAWSPGTGSQYTHLHHEFSTVPHTKY